VDLICIGGFHSSRVSRDLLARQRQQVIDRAACPVLVVK
jgi:nucleotide-binding universal stress UspA family protein